MKDIIKTTAFVFGILICAAAYISFIFVVTFVGQDGTYYNCMYVETNPQWPDSVKKRCGVEPK